ncbi:lysoplasmalogenase family protein [Flavobacterium polysaccharolyticum]|uniref:Lysoplasmalogenase family protein n=1 Tax=Flavobacterium polysaccharolyticum TaxID=3133148 RepID=A0ABU9NNZ6_9FLAO
MKIDRLLVVLYFVLCFMVGVLSIFRLGEIILYLKGVIVLVVALIFFVQDSKFSPVVATILLLSFFGETYYLYVKSYTETIPIVLFLCINLIFLGLSWLDVKEKEWSQAEFFKLVVLMGLLGALAYIILSLDLKNTDVNFILYIIYSIVFVVMFILSFANFVKTHQKSSLYLVLFGLSVFISDLSLLLNNYFIKLAFLRIGGNLSQVLGYYLMMHYFLERNKKEEFIKVDN